MKGVVEISTCFFKMTDCGKAEDDDYDIYEKNRKIGRRYRYFGAFIDEEGQFAMRDFAAQHCPAGLNKWVEDDLHLTISHRNNRGSSALQRWIRDNFNREVELRVDYLAFDEGIAAFFLTPEEPKFETVTGNYHVTVLMADGEYPMNASRLAVPSPARKVIPIDEGASFRKVRAIISSWEDM